MIKTSKQINHTFYIDCLFDSSTMLKIICLLLICDLVKAQNCRPAGGWCSDDELCCGGCCIHNTCINTYEDCRTLDNPCFHHPCPGDAECRLYQPNCQGCEIQWMCVFPTKQPQQSEVNGAINDGIVTRNGHQVNRSNLSVFVIISIMLLF